MSIDKDQLAAQLGFKRGDVEMLLGIFAKNAASALHDMQDRIEKNDLQGIGDAAHAIKGSAGNLKLQEIYTLAKSIEDAAKQKQQIDYRDYYRQLASLITAL